MAAAESIPCDIHFRAGHKAFLVRGASLVSPPKTLPGKIDEFSQSNVPSASIAALMKAFKPQEEIVHVKARHVVS